MAGRNFKISDINLNLPQMDETLRGWEVNVYANYTEQEEVDGDIVERNYTKTIIGVRQPLKSQEVALLPEGQRSWQWYWLHVDAKYPQLQYQQQVTIKGEDYRVMAIKDYSLDGFFEYYLVKDYQEDNGEWK